MTFSDTLATDAGIVLALVFLEAVLSFDNAAILAALSRRLPLGEGRRRALNYGLGIAYVLRIGAILCAVLLLRYPVFLLIGAAYLIFLFVKHFGGMLLGKGEDHARLEKQDGDSKPFLMRLGFTAFSATILQIGVVDLAFALDQVVTAVGITRIPYLIIIASTIGLLSLRLVAPYLSRLMDWLPSLEHIAYVAVGFVGVLLTLESISLHGGIHLHHHGDETDSPIYVIPTALKTAITLSLFAIPILVKLVFKWPKSHGSHHTTIEESLREAERPTPSVEALHHAKRESDATRVREPYPPPPVLPEGARLAVGKRPDDLDRPAPAKPAKKAGKPAKKAASKAAKKR